VSVPFRSVVSIICLTSSSWYQRGVGKGW
jgi:hypothetical protein